MYKYLHKNGTVISKPNICVLPDPEAYFRSDMVVRWWYCPGNGGSTQRNIDYRQCKNCPERKTCQ